ncbi:MAG: NAD(+)/NADH kinase [Desulfobulbaceae bacterium]|nr:MAG: NAD(+)/NADH kinase [Desulfobulbaceae bacterium]
MKVGKVDKLGIIIKRESPEPLRIGREMAEWFSARGIMVSLDRIEEDQDLLIVLGGDGTLLHVAAEACRHEIPVLGINLGGLGFLTGVAADDRQAIMAKIVADELPVEERMMLQVRLWPNKLVAGLVNEESGNKPWVNALNEVVINKGTIDRMTEMAAWVNGEYLTTYRADGLVIATSTGSTAYNLSAGGPVVHPRLNAIVVTPICPFMLTSRPVLLDADSRVVVRISPASSGEIMTDQLKVIVDGRHYAALREGDVLEVMVSAKKLRLIPSPWKGYFEILRSKLNWGGGHQQQPPPTLSISC